MLTPAQAIDAIRNSIPEFATESVPMADCCGRILRQTVIAERDQPPFDRVTMDGIAIRYDALRGGRRTFRIQGTQHAGDPVQALQEDGNCIEIMTGAVLPTHSDCIVPVERLRVGDGMATIEPGYAASRNQFIHPRGSDHPKGQALLDSGTVIAPTHVAIIASCGLTSVNVSSLPTIRIVSTGDELVPAGKAIAAHQVRLSNGPALVAMLRQHGFDNSAHEHIVDRPELLRETLARHLIEASVLILSGGVSMGKADFVPGVLADLGVRQVFHRISQRPGKPMWFGIGPRNQAVFALPGNPVSTLVCCRQYVLPSLFTASARRASSQRYAVLADDFEFGANLTCFLPVRTSSRDDGVVVASPVPTNTSGDFTALGGTDGYVELQQDRSHFSAGTCVPLHPWDHP